MEQKFRIGDVVSFEVFLFKPRETENEVILDKDVYDKENWQGLVASYSEDNNQIEVWYRCKVEKVVKTQIFGPDKLQNLSRKPQSPAIHSMTTEIDKNGVFDVHHIKFRLK